MHTLSLVCSYKAQFERNSNRNTGLLSLPDGSELEVPDIGTPRNILDNCDTKSSALFAFAKSHLKLKVFRANTGKK